MASLVADWDSRVRAYLTATSGRDEEEVEAGFGDDGLLYHFEPEAEAGSGDDGVLYHFEPEAEAVGNDGLLRQEACGFLPWNFVDASTYTPVSSPVLVLTT
jgi:hypothetical protein